MSLKGTKLHIQWSLYNLDTIGTKLKCPDYGGVLNSEGQLNCKFPDPLYPSENCALIRVMHPLVVSVIEAT